MDLPELISPAELAASQALGAEVHRVLARAGLPAFCQPDFRAPPAGEPGAHVGVEPMVAGQVNVAWKNSAELLDASVAESGSGNVTGPAVRLNVAATHAMAAAIAAILRAAGFDAALGVDMDPGAVRVRRAA